MKETRDPRTRERLVQEAAQLFADRGFKNVTVRQICAAARANVAAVNYHFGDKNGLYRAVVETAIQAMKETSELVIEAGRGASPEERLRAYIRVFLERLAARDRHAWIHKLMNRELEEHGGETMGLVMTEVIAPRLQYLGEVLAEITGLPISDRRVTLIMMSIQGQLLLFARPRPARLPPDWAETLADVPAVADHIASFSLAAIQAMAAPARPRDDGGAGRKRIYIS